MYKIIGALGVVLLAISTTVVQLAALDPAPTANSVLAEKSSIIMGGQAAVLIPNNLSNSQRQLLNAAYAIAKADGHKNPELVQGIILQESKAGAMSSYKVAGNPGDQYYGLMQIKKEAALDVLKVYPELYKKYSFQTRTNDELVANLILTPKFNIEVGSKYLKILQTRYGFSGRELVNAYNRGPGGVKAVGNDFHYAIGAEAKLAAYKRGSL
jgi:soluble lytic murein transglycosylase-like protein